MEGEDIKSSDQNGDSESPLWDLPWRERSCRTSCLSVCMRWQQLPCWRQHSGTVAWVHQKFDRHANLRPLQGDPPYVPRKKIAQPTSTREAHTHTLTWSQPASSPSLSSGCLYNKPCWSCCPDYSVHRKVGVCRPLPRNWNSTTCTPAVTPWLPTQPPQSNIHLHHPIW